MSNFDKFRGMFLFWSIVLSGAGFFFPGFFFPALGGKNSAPGKKNPAPGKKNPAPAPGKKNPAPESTMDQNSKILQNSSKLVVARDEATKEIGHEHIIFPREDCGFRNDDEDIEVYFFSIFP